MQNLKCNNKIDQHNNKTFYNTKYTENKREQYWNWDVNDHLLYFQQEDTLFIRLGIFLLQQQQETCFFVFDS